MPSLKTDGRVSSPTCGYSYAYSGAADAADARAAKAAPANDRHAPQITASTELNMIFFFMIADILPPRTCNRSGADGPHSNAAGLDLSVRFIPFTIKLYRALFGV